MNLPAIPELGLAAELAPLRLTDLPVLAYAVREIYGDNNMRFNEHAIVPEAYRERALEVEGLLGVLTGQRFKDLNKGVRSRVMNILADEGQLVDEESLLLPFVAQGGNEWDLLLMGAVGFSLGSINAVHTLLDDAFEGELSRAFVKGL